jgi:hypothetical protein
MIRSRPIFLTLNKLEAKLIAKALRYTTSHVRAEIGFTEYQMFNELTKRMQSIARGEEKERVDDFMSSSIKPGMDDDIVNA